MLRPDLVVRSIGVAEIDDTNTLPQLGPGRSIRTDSSGTTFYLLVRMLLPYRPDLNMGSIDDVGVSIDDRGGNTLPCIDRILGRSGGAGAKHSHIYIWDPPVSAGANASPLQAWFEYGVDR